MTDKELKELEFAIHCKYSTKRDFIEKTCSKLIKQEQSRCAVQPEEVQEVIDDLDCLISEITINEHIPIAYGIVVTKAITALRYYGGIENDK